MLNKATLIGNVGGDPDIRDVPNGDRVASFTIATSERWKDKNGERQERTEWHRVTIWNEGLIKVVENYVKKGSKLYLEGQLQTRKWQDKNGTDHYTTEIVLKPFRGQLALLDSKGAQETNDHQSGHSPGANSTTTAASYAEVSGHYSGNQATQTSHQRPLDDDIPFKKGNPHFLQMATNSKQGTNPWPLMTSPN